MNQVPGGMVARYRDLLPDIGPEDPVITLHEGSTPLIPAPALARWIVADVPGATPPDLWLKVEGANPTGSFKDRGMTMAVSRAVAEGRGVVVCASTGNTSASAAAYAARAGIRCAVVLPRGEVALGKLSQAIVHGAEVLAIDGNFDDALRLVREIAETEPVALVNSVNPVRIEGQKTAAFEVVDALGDAPEWHALPVGNAGNITAYWRGYREYHRLGRSASLPRMLGFQAEGAAPLVAGSPVSQPTTLATAIRIGNPASWHGAISAASESGGSFHAVSDAEILSAWRSTARLEGVFAEPASLAPIAGLRRLANQGWFTEDRSVRVVATLTGNGLKDPDRVVKELGGSLREVPADKDVLCRILGGSNI
ncbi:MAG: threonine synthase [Armatimonadota bacterium]